MKGIKIKYLPIFINKSSKSKYPSYINKSSSKHSIKCTGTSGKVKLKLKKNGFFDEPDQISSHRGKERINKKITEDANLMDQ